VDIHGLSGLNLSVAGYHAGVSPSGSSKIRITMLRRGKESHAVSVASLRKALVRSVEQSGRRPFRCLA